MRESLSEMETGYQAACLAESHRLRIAEAFANAHESVSSRLYRLGRKDRLAGIPCRSSDGSYLDGWYSI